MDNIEELYKGKYIRLLRKNKWEFVQRINVSGIVVILAITDDNKVIFTEQFRPPLSKKVIEFPAGLVGDIEGNEDESLVEAAKRELLEETGYEASFFEYLIEGPPSCGISSEIITLFKATNLTKINEGGGDPTEDILVHEINLNDAFRWLKSKKEEGFLVDPKVYAGLYFFER